MATQRVDLSPVEEAFYEHKLLLGIKPLLQYNEHGQKRTMPTNVGGKVLFTRMKPLPIRTTPLTETWDLGIARDDYKKIESMEIEASPERYGDVLAITERADKLAFREQLNEKTSILSQQAAESVEEVVKLEVGKGLMRRRADGNAAYQKDGKASGAGTTMTLVDAARNEAADYWNGGYITFINPMDSNYGVTAKIATSVVGTLTFETPLKYPTQANISKYRLVVGTGISAASSTLTSEALLAALRDLKTTRARPMKDGKYVCIIDPYVEYDFMHDADWKAAAIYKDSAKNLYNGEIGTWLNIRFVSASLTYRETQAGIYDREDGDIHVITLLGSDAYGVIGLGSSNVKLNMMNPHDLGQALPSYHTAAWEAWFATKTLNATFGINILCGASK